MGLAAIIVTHFSHFPPIFHKAELIKDDFFERFNPKIKNNAPSKDEFLEEEMLAPLAPSAPL